MRIMHLETGMHLYGGAEQVRCLIQGLSAQGVESVLVCAQGSAIATATVAKDVVEIPMRGDLDLNLYKRLRALLNSINPDLLHVHSRRGADWFGGCAALSCSVPAVLTRRVDNPEAAFVARIKYRPYRVVIAISRIIEALLLEHVRLPIFKVQRIASAVDTERFRPGGGRERLLAALELPEDVLLIGIVAQLIPRKGHDVLLGILPELVDRYPRLKVLFLGQGRQAAKLRRQIGEFDLNARVKLLGFRDDLPCLLPALDLLVHPARREGMGVAVLQAMSAGVPVVASSVGGIIDVIQNEVQGLLVEPDNPTALAAALQRLLADPELRNRLGTAGRVRVEARFSISRMTAGYLAVYGSVLGGYV